MKSKKAMLIWNEHTTAWDLYKMNMNGEWVIRESWQLKDVNPKNKMGWVSDKVLCRIAAMQLGGYDVQVRG